MADYRWKWDDNMEAETPVEVVAPLSILDEAARVTSGDRQDWYGHPMDNHSCTAEMIGAYIRRRQQHPSFTGLDAYDVCLMNVLQKVSRLAHDRRRDGLVDIAGYAGNAGEIMERLDGVWQT